VESNAARGAVAPHNAKPASVWSSGGGDYEEISSQISTALEHAVRRLQPQPGERILDLATGTGWTSRIAARRGAAVTGADIAEELLAAARRRAQAEGLNVEYVTGDAEALPFDDASFDAVISTFGVMFVTRPESAAHEIARVCRRGGRIALATWTPDGAVFEMFKVMRPYMTPPPSPPPSPFAWGTRERITELFGDAFDLAFEDGVANYYDRSGQAAWEAFVTGYGPTKSLAASLDPQRRAELERDFTAFHDRYRSDLGICVPREYLLTIGVRK
jgi:ubiquinone/menaquinone biosynthesis C-methylase UbiE